MTPDLQGPLAGVRIIDLTTVVMGPYATQILADLGADVIKVESFAGDNMRQVGPMRNPGMGHIFLHLNRNKRSIVLDLKQSAGRDALLRLTATADVFVYNVRPQALTRLGLAYTEMAKSNPRIIHVGCFGYGQAGPYAAQAAYDDLIQGAIGVPWMQAQQSGHEPRYTPITLADRATGLNVVNAVTAALYSRERNGRGQAVEVPMFESLAQFVLSDNMAGKSFDPPLGEAGYQRMLAPDRRPYATLDGHICLLVYNDAQWQRFFAAIGQAERFARDPLFSSHGNRAARIREVYAFVAEVIAGRSSAEWLEILAAADLPVSRMNSLDDLIDDEHLASVGFFTWREHPSEGRIREMGVPSTWSGTPPNNSRPAPRLGEHGCEVLREIGYSDDEIAALRDANVTNQANP